uniref:daf-12-interacting protein 1 isoform X1 n=1 Tax=Anopheles coluzzii TaxID=1518534 RepID=UPI0020FFCBA9|nr:daf-12-interacting protein 1 isoform X1 [Anopheles coluzzii]
MKLPALLFSFGLITGVLSQGFGQQPPPFRPIPKSFAVPPKAQRRQLTQQQQTHILSDIQKHQHRFNLHQNQRSPNVFIQPSIQIPVPPQPHSRQTFSGPSSTQQHFQPNAHFHHHSNNLHPPPPLSSPANGPVNSFRAPSGRPGPSFGAQQDTRLPPQQRSVQNQLQQATFFNGPPPPPHTNGPAPVSQPLNSQPSSFLNSIDTPTFGAPQRPNSLQAPFLQTPPSFTGNGQVRFPSQGAPSNGANLGQQPVPLFTNQQLPLHNSPQNFKLSGPNAGQSTFPVQPTFHNSQSVNPALQFPPLSQSIGTNFQQPSPQFQQQQQQQQLPRLQPNVPFAQSSNNFNAQPQGAGFPQAQPQIQTFSGPQQPVQSAQFGGQATNFNGLQQQQQQPLSYQQQQEYERRLKEESERIRELQEKQKVIQKHEQFLQKQYQKQQAKVQQLHQEFLKKQQKILQQQQQQQQQQQYEQQQKTVPTQVRSRDVLPSERTLFEKAVKMQSKPVAVPEPTTSTAAATSGQLSVIPLKPNSKKDYSSITQSDLDVLLSANRQTLFQTIKSETAKPAKAKPTKVKSTKALGRDDLLKQLKLALAETSPDLGGMNYSSTDLVLPNGEKVQVIRTTDPEIIKRANANSEGVLTQQLDSPTTPKPLSFEDIARSGLLPPGADFELIKQTEDGQIQEVGKIPPQKKVTFVYLEEQDDGSYKVQGVKGSGDKETKTSGADVDSILKRIKNGEIQLPPPSSVVSKGSVAKPDLIEDAPITTTTPRHQPIKKANSVTIIPHSTPIEDHASTAFLSGSTVHHTASPAPATIYASTPSPASPSSGVTAYSPGGYSGSTLPQQVSARLSTPSPVSGSYTADSTARFSEANSVYTPVSTTAIPPATPAPSIYQTANTEKYFSDTATAAAIEQQQQTASTYQHQTIHASHQSTASDAVPTASASETITQQQQDNTLSAPKEDTQQQQNELPAILKNNGLFAMAKYLRQSGLDTILNETGPYTIFVPTDKAFRSLLVQLGGPEKAEEKFRNNPRLLSGLLLHHVIPGSFEIASLQDEMTGVSLAGTQLRVNQYNMHDSEWNDVKVTTINGAMVVPDKQDIVIPQGIAHAVDRVMFPLPVGDILQTLQSDRERRFTHFLRALFASGMSDTLQNKGIKTYTVFAPTDAAFAHLSTEELTNLVTEKDQAEELVRKHVVPGTLFTAGMRFYQVKDVMAEGKTVTLQKTGGKIKVNDGYLQTSNIPTTNGVIHAIDSLL